MSKLSKTSGITTKDLVHMSFFVALICVCSFISIPFTVPLTLQTFAVFVTILFFDIKKSFLTILTYILLGAVGLPVFSNFAGGVGYLFGVTGGYIIGFLFTALTTGFLMKKTKKSKLMQFIAMFAGLIVCYAFGTAWFMLVYTSNGSSIGIVSALTMCVFPYIIPDIAKMILAILLVKKVKKFSS